MLDNGSVVDFNKSVTFLCFICLTNAFFFSRRILSDQHESTVDGRGHIPLCGGLLCFASVCALHLPQEVSHPLQSTGQNKPSPCTQSNSTSAVSNLP